MRAWPVRLSHVGVFAIATALAGCGGGGGGAVGTAPQPAQSAAAGTAEVHLVIMIPRTTSSTSRAPQYVSPATARISVSVGGNTTSGACAAPATTCSFNFVAPLGSDTFTISAYDASAVLLGTGTTIATILPNGVNTIAVTFDGIVASLSVILSPNTLLLGLASTTTLSVLAADADGYTILQPGNYAQPLQITTSPPLPAPLSFGGPTNISAIPPSPISIPVNYTGGVVSGPITFTATSGTVSGSAALTIPASGALTVSPNPVQFTTVPGAASLSVSEGNYGGSFAFAQSPPGSCAGIVSLGTFAGGSLPLTSLGVGTCNIRVSDTIGGSVLETVNVETTTLVGS
jgi:hypothetical protein